MSNFQCVKLNIHYRGDVTLKDDSFDYIGGFKMKDMVIDPDLMTWSNFDDFCKENGVFCAVEQVWYKLPHEDISSARVIGSDKDSGIRELCRQALIGGEADVYIQHGLSEPEPFPLSNPDEYYVAEENEESDEEVGEDRTAEEQRVQDEGEDPVEEGLQDDPRFADFFQEVHNETDEARGQKYSLKI